jgi:hypothetical protein
VPLISKERPAMKSPQGIDLAGEIGKTINDAPRSAGLLL